jgi:biopolymer transport protein ExbD
MRPALRETSTAGSDTINLTPLLDVLFLILFFFLLATEAKREVPAIDVELPELGELTDSREVPPDEMALLTITREGGVFLDRKEVGVAGLASALAELDSAKVTGIVIRVDGRADSELLIQAMAICGGANFSSTLVEYATDGAATSR